MGDIINGILRGILWWVTSFCLTIMDMVYEICERIALIDVGEYTWVWDWFRGICGLMFLFIICRIIYTAFRAILDEDFAEKANPIKIYNKLLKTALVISLIPILLPVFSGLATNLNANLNNIIGIEGETKPSSIIIAAGYQGDPNDIDFSSIDINEEANDEYLYFPSNFDIMFTLVASVCACIIFVFVAIQVGQRVFGLLFKILIAPFSVSSLVSYDDDSFSVWLKLVVSDLITTWFQLLIIMASLTIVTAVDLGSDQIGLIAKVIFFICGLLAAMTAPTGIAQLLGNDVGVGSGLAQLQSLTAVGTGVNASATTIAGAGVTAAALGTYSVGRAFGAKSAIGNGFSNIGRNIPPGNGSDASSGNGGTGINTFASPNTDNFSADTTGGYSNSASSSGINNTGSGFNSVGSGSNNVNDSSRITKEHTPLRVVGNALQKRGYVGNAVNRGAGSLYMASAKRLSRDGVKKTKMGTQARTSNFVRTSNVEHAIRREVHDAWSSIPRKTSKEDV